MANWTKPYKTYDVNYVTKQIEAFYDLYEKASPHEVKILLRRLPVFADLDEEGRFASSCRPELRGLPVLTEGSDAVTKLLADHVVRTGSYTHSYPYDWRSKQPVIVRSSRQWFINLDDNMRQRALLPSKLLHLGLTVLHLSAQGLFCLFNDFFSHCNRIASKEYRFYRNQHAPCFTGTQFNYVCFLCQLGVCKDAALTRGQDIMDIWLDSGLSWKMVLPEPFQADVYLEGLDQVRGWFQSSLLTSVALTGKAPYRLYCDAEDSTSRRSCQTALSHVLDVLVNVTAPIIPHLGEEVFYYHGDPGKCKSSKHFIHSSFGCSTLSETLRHLCESVQFSSPHLFLPLFRADDTGIFRRAWQPPPHDWERLEFAQLEKPLARLREAVNKAAAKSRPLLHDVRIISTSRDSRFASCLRLLQPEDSAIHSGLTDVLQVASVTFEQADDPTVQAGSDRAVILETEDEKVLIALEPTKMAVCERCRRNISSEQGCLCKRCEEVYQRLHFKWDALKGNANAEEQEDKIQTKSRT
ncbi:hypothetical protein HPB51_024071 [Rhipicephalus microplus]|uniref:Isoleucyl-tRNA synthetase n=1 Tax=Rhipicephalus microplus TaxID=6941 RepID=A0A9J6ED47_RHIMP|nr:hypothetical protein HPB51_024071 [Rhipicephalus microplus]